MAFDDSAAAEACEEFDYAYDEGSYDEGKYDDELCLDDGPDE